MKNIVVYTDKNESKLADVLAQIDDANVRIENAENLKEYEMLNPGLIVIESVPNVKDVLEIFSKELQFEQLFSILSKLQLIILNLLSEQMHF